MLTGISLSSNVSIGLNIVRGTSVDGKVNLCLTLFSSIFQDASVEICYRTSPCGEWLTDTNISFSMAQFRSDNKLHGLPCSPQGSKSILTWDYESNGIAFGSHVSIQANVIPSVTTMNNVGQFSRIETSFQGGDRHISSGIFNKLVGIDNFNNLIVLSDHKVELIDQATRQVETEVSLAGQPVHAIGSDNGVIVAESNGTLSEFDFDGILVRSLDASAFASGDISLDFNSSISSLLVSGGNIPTVSEICWGGESHGTQLWNYICPAGSMPSGATYSNGVGVVAFCEMNNGKVVIVDRTTNPETVIENTSAIIGEQTIAFYKPKKCIVQGNIAYVVEESGVPRHFGNTSSTHEGLSRINVDNTFSGMCFVPIIRSIK